MLENTTTSDDNFHYSIERENHSYYFPISNTYVPAKVYYLNMPLILTISKNTKLNGLPYSRVDYILLNGMLVEQLDIPSLKYHRALGICGGVA